MQVIASWTGGQADALRQALRMTNESFADHLGVAVRTIANWRKRPDMIPQPQIQEVLDAALERATDRVKAQFALLAGQESGTPAGLTGNGSPFSVPLDAMTRRDLLVHDRSSFRVITE
jgi:transcriptional regulator with XRE-family HTH domain